MSALMIGYGNPIRGDDGVGWQVAEDIRLAGSPLDRRSIAGIACHQLLPELCDQISAADLVIFVDANAGGEPGQVRMRPEFPNTAAPPSSHHFPPAALLAHTCLLYGTCPPAYLITVNGERFDYQAGLSPTVMAALPTVYEVVASILAEFEVAEP